MKKTIALMALSLSVLSFTGKTEAMAMNHSKTSGLETLQGFIFGPGPTIWDPRPREEGSQQDDGQEPKPDRIEIRR